MPPKILKDPNYTHIPVVSNLFDLPTHKGNPGLYMRAVLYCTLDFYTQIPGYLWGKILTLVENNLWHLEFDSQVASKNQVVILGFYHFFSNIFHINDLLVMYPIVSSISFKF